ncbi:hypothetical protein MMC30_003638 [Trapelia coarctata]|nr:hypothetical protein [Trapelia coarctata]
MSRYHWGLIIGPKVEVKDGRGMRYHAKETLLRPGQNEWSYEEREISLAPTNMLLVRIMIGKVADVERAVSILRSVPVVQGSQTWNCVVWVKNALEGLQADGKAMGTSKLEWRVVRDAAMRYCQHKRDQHRFDGTTSVDTSKAPTYDLLEGREAIP